MGVYYKMRANGTRVWYYDLCVDGRRLRGIGGNTKREAVETLAALREKYRRGHDVFQKPEDPTFEDFASEFLVWSQNNKRSFKRDEQLVENLMRWFRHYRLSSIHPADVERFKAERKQEKRRGSHGTLNRQISNATVNREVACLKRMFNLAMQWGKALRNPVNAVRFLQEPPKKERYVTPIEARRLIDAAYETMKPVLICAFNTGMRLQEILSMQWPQVDLYDPPRQLIGGGLHYGHIELLNTKNGKKRIVPINRDLWQVLVDLKRKNKYGCHDVFQSSNGRRFSNINDQLKNLIKRAGVEPATFHDFRHSWASWMSERGEDIYTIMEIGGWSSLAVLQRYLHRSKRNLILAAQRLDGILETGTAEERQRSIRQNDRATRKSA